MTDKGNMRRVFPGGNTSLGFYSFYEYVLPQEEAKRIFVLKGGPGVGKSTFMVKIADDLINRGFDVECLHCSSDNDSLDGIFIPSIKIALIDGTAPHVVDPKNPGAVDEIINLGEYWNVSKIELAKEEVLRVNKKTGRLFSIAYSLLKEARVAYDEWKGYEKDSLDISAYNSILKGLIGVIFSKVPDNFQTVPKKRHLFASAITPGGLVNYVDTLITPEMKVYALEGDPGSGIKELLAKVAQAAFEKGLYTEQFHCPFEPEELDLVIIPEINTAVINTTKPYHFDVSKAEKIRVESIINLNICLDKKKLFEYEKELNDAKVRFESLLNNAIEHIARAKSVHDAMEKYYVSSMNFKGVEEKRLEILRRILVYANKH